MPVGFLYVLINPSIPGLAKVGKTTRSPSDRVTELSSASGVPSPFVLAYQQPVSDCDSAEIWVHRELERQGYRHASNREFFNAPLHEIVKIVAQAEEITAHLDAETSADGATSSENNQRNTADELFELATQYAEGTDGLLRNDKTALRLFEQAAALGHGMACIKAATAYRFGNNGIRTDKNKALSYYQRSIRCGMWFAEAFVAGIFMESGQSTDAEAHWNLFFESASEVATRMHDDLASEEVNALNDTIFFFGVDYCVAVAAGHIGDCVSDQVSKEVWRSIERAIDGQLADVAREHSELSLYELLFTDPNEESLRAARRYIEQKLENSVDIGLFIRLAKAGNPSGQLGLAKLYEIGHGVAQNDEEAAKWFEKAAEQGNVDAQRTIAGRYYQGRGVSQNYNEAAKWFLRGAEQGDINCQFNIGNLFLTGHGVTESEADSFVWFLKAAGQGHSVAQFNIGVMYENGQGVERNDEEAAKCFEKAAENNHSEAQFQLGQMFEQGRGVEKNYDKALELYRKSAEADIINAQYCLGRMFENGLGTDQDLREARRWYMRAAENGQSDALDALKEMNVL